MIQKMKRLNFKSIRLFLFFTLIITLFFSSQRLASSPKKNESKLEGEWILKEMAGIYIPFDSLYPSKKPFIKFDEAKKMVSGNTSCNNFSGQLLVNGNKIDLSKSIAMTKMACIDGRGEHVFVEALSKVKSWSISNNTLELKQGKNSLMKFKKK